MVYEGSVYRISYEIVDERPATQYFWRFEPADDGPDDETVRFEDLPEQDRERFRWAGLADGADDESGVTGGAFTYADGQRETSALVPAPDRPIIVWGPDRRVRFTVTKANDEDATLRTYRYRPEQLASSVEAYGGHLREQYAFELSGLSEDERAIVDQATQKNGFAVHAGGQVPDAFESVAQRFSEEAAIESYIGGNAGDYLASYEGEVHDTRLIHREGGGTETTVSGE